MPWETSICSKQRRRTSHPSAASASWLPSDSSGHLAHKPSSKSSQNQHQWVVETINGNYRVQRVFCWLHIVSPFFGVGFAKLSEMSKTWLSLETWWNRWWKFETSPGFHHSPRFYKVFTWFFTIRFSPGFWWGFQLVSPSFHQGATRL